MKTCSRCEQQLPRDMFYRERKAPDGLYRWCKPCRKAYLAENAAQVRERHNDYIARVGRPDDRAHKQRLRRYGLTSEQFDSLLQDQGSLCAICRQVEPTVIDHDHNGGRVRGLLCNNCNVGIGMLGDCRDRLAAALAYLDRVVSGSRAASGQSTSGPSCNAGRDEVADWPVAS